MNKEESRLQRALAPAWNRAYASARRISQVVEMRPSAFEDVFQFVQTDHADEIALEIKTVVMAVPERADTATGRLYIAFTGHLAFDRAALEAGMPPLTQRFGTKVGYFRLKQGRLVHIYGAHYDLDEATPGHPIFHHQMTNLAHLKDQVAERFGLKYEEFDDQMKPVLRQVRVPTAQMDGFSVLAQICSDHLMHKGSASNERALFRDILRYCYVFRGAAHRMPLLSEGDAPHCYRGVHWYGAALN